MRSRPMFARAQERVLFEREPELFRGPTMPAHSSDPHPWPEPDPHPEPAPDPRPDPVPYRGDPPVRIIDLPPNTPTPGIPVEHSL